MLFNRNNQTNISEENIAVAEEVFINDISNNIVILDAIVPTNIGSNISLPQYEYNFSVIRPFMSIRDRVVKVFWLSFVLNLCYLIINPFSVIHIPILIMNLYCFKLYTKYATQTVICCNLFLIFTIFLYNLAIILNFSALARYLILNEIFMFRVMILYTLILLFSSIIIMCQLLFFIYNYARSLILYRSLTDEQKILLLEVL